MSVKSQVEQLLALQNFAVAGASRDKEKPGFHVYAALKRAGKTVFPINPAADNVDGDECYSSLDNIPGLIDCLVTVTPPEITLEILKEAAHLRIQNVWMQPGSESKAAVNFAHAWGMEVVSGGPCVWQTLEPHAEETASGG